MNTGEIWQLPDLLGQGAVCPLYNLLKAFGICGAWHEANFTTKTSGYHSRGSSQPCHPASFPRHPVFLKGGNMPERETLERAREDAREGKSPSTQAGEFVREEMHHIREGKHGADSPQQAIAIGLSKARRAGVKLPPPKAGKTSTRTRTQAQRDLRKGQSSRRRKPSARRSRAVSAALKRKGRAAASHTSLAQQARRAARTRGRRSLHTAAMKAVRTKGKAGLRQAARKAAHTRTTHRRAA